MELYGQQTEVALLGALRPHLRDGAFVDVGAERGGLAQALIAYGYGPAHLIEPAPENAAALRAAFSDDPAAKVLELAAGADDGEAVLYLAQDDRGEPMPAFNTLDAPGEDGMRWSAAGTVPRRTLGSLLAEGQIPAKVALLKIDAEGADRDVIAGMGDLRCEALMIEHWLDLPGTVGPCPWTLDELRALLEPRGLERIVYVHHHLLEVRVVDGAAEPEVGDYGNLVFLTAELYERARGAIELVAERAAALSEAQLELDEKERNIQLYDRNLQVYAAAAEERKQVIEALMGAGPPESDRSLRARTWRLQRRARARIRTLAWPWLRPER